MASVALQHVTVTFPVYDASTRSLKKRLLPARTGGNISSSVTGVTGSVVTALQDITLTIDHGQRVALIGHNGAGKTTLLRVLAGIYEPELGRVEVDGITAPLFDIGLGMEAEATGYDNIILRGLFLGCKRSEIRARQEEIAAFTELGDFLGLPLRTYSTGMRMRLAFAVSTAIAPDVLLLDEGIAAGDAAFMDKARARLRSFASQASIIVLASHSEALVRELCDKAVILDRGRIAGMGAVDEMLRVYAQIRFSSRS